jgi:hypothetical protein
MPEPTATVDKAAGTTILTKQEPPKPTPDATLFKTEQEKADALAAAKAQAIKELEEKMAADKTAADKAAADKIAADAAAAKKAEEEKVKAAGTVTAPPKKEGTTSQTDYTLTLPDNSPLTQEDLDGLLKEAKESGLSEEQAKQALQETDQVARTAQARLVQKQTENLKAMVTGWKEAVKKDPEMGGENLAATAIKASRAFKAVASPALQLFCEQTGYADHPEMVRMMLKVYELIGEDKFIRGVTGVQNTTPTTLEEKAKRLFGNPIKEAAV